MRNVVLLLLCLCAITALQAQTPWLKWDSDHAIRQGTNIEWFRTATMLGNNFVVSWSDTKSGERDLYAQCIDPQGNAVWGTQPLLIDNKIDRQEDPVAVTTSDNSIVIAWVDFSQDQKGDIFAQKISATGQLLWQQNGIPVCVTIGEQIGINMVPDNNGGVILIWNDHRATGIDIYGAHLDSNGVNTWTTNGIQFGDNNGDETSNTFWEDGQGGAFLAYMYKPNGGISKILVDHINGDGTLASGPTPIHNVNYIQQGVKIAPDNNGGFILAWEEKIAEASVSVSILAQRVMMNGTLAWDNPVTIMDGEFIRGKARIVGTSNGAIIVWEDNQFDETHSNPDLLAQRLDLLGNKMWAEAGVQVSVMPEKQQDVRLVSDQNDGFFAVWDDSRVSDDAVDVYMQHITSTGTPSLEANGIAISSAVGKQNGSLIKASNDKLYVVWSDARTGSIGINYQILNYNGVAQLEDNGRTLFWGLSGNAEKIQSAKSGNDMIVSWEDSRGANFGTQIYWQKINSMGETLLPENGKSLSVSNGNNQSLYSFYANDNGGVTAAWKETQGGSDVIVAQQTDANGNYQWGDNGILPSEIVNTHTTASPLIAPLNAGSVIVWLQLDENYFQTICAQYIVNGQLSWTNQGKVIVPNPTTNMGGATYAAQSPLIYLDKYIVFSREAMADTSNALDIFITKIDDNGNIANGWPTEGVPVCQYPMVQTNVQAAIVPQGILVTWEDQRNYTKDIYAQIITPAGQPLLAANGVPLVDSDQDQSYYHMEYDNTNSLIRLVWKDFVNGNDDISMQTYTIANNQITPTWANNGIFVADTPDQEVTPYIASINNFSLVTWSTTYNEYNTDLFVQLIKPDGSVANPASPNGAPVTTAIKTQDQAQIVKNDNNESYIVWNDERSSGKETVKGIYSQCVKTSYFTSNDDYTQTISPVCNFTNYPNPFNPSTNIRFELKNNANVELAIYNMKGQLIKTVAKEKMIPGFHTVTWNGTDNNNHTVSSGIYFAKIKTDQSSLTKKMIMIK